MTVVGMVDAHLQAMLVQKSPPPPPRVPVHKRQSTQLFLQAGSICTCNGVLSRFQEVGSTVHCSNTAERMAVAGMVLLL